MLIYFFVSIKIIIHFVNQVVKIEKMLKPLHCYWRVGYPPAVLDKVRVTVCTMQETEHYQRRKEGRNRWCEKGG